jgi:hypothetical protein
VAKYYLHVCNGIGFIEDTDGHDCTDLAAARLTAIAGLRDILAGELRDGSLNTASFVEIEDEDHKLVATITFPDVVRMTSDVPRPPRQ